MYLDIQREIRNSFVQTVEQIFGLNIPEPIVEVPPSLDMGDLSIAACFELAKQLRQPPRKIAEQLAQRLAAPDGVERVSVAGAGYVNFHLKRADCALALYRLRLHPPETPAAGDGKILVEHTSINPNKAAHIGHLRNAALGDTFVRLLRFRGKMVEVQNYIDNTGVQVADVVVGFVHLEKKSTAEVRQLIEDASIRFDYLCWGVYARVFKFYEQQPEALSLRAQALKDIEEGQGEMAAMAEAISTTITRKHLETMQRLNVQYDLLVGESEILRLDFWKYAFEVLKKTGAIRFEESGKNRGCWVMSLDSAAEGETGDEAGSEDVKIIVRSNGTVTYVGKDIAYHLWKFDLLGKDFGYEIFFRYPDGHRVWRTTLKGQPDAPAFGRAAVVYSVIDTRQSYLQDVVAAAFNALGFHQQAANLHHFAYEVVGLSPRCARQMGVDVGEGDRGYVEVSGRKGLGVKADDLIDALIEKALQEVQTRRITEDLAEQTANARMIAVGALRYFLLKFSRRVIIAFDFNDALAFEGETGPYLQYTVVRAENIFQKFREGGGTVEPQDLVERVTEEQLKSFYSSKDGPAFWELTVLAAQLEMSVEQAVASTEPAVVTKYAFRLAQAFNNFYHHHHVLSEADASRQQCLLFLVYLVKASLTRTLDLMGIEVPPRM